MAGDHRVTLHKRHAFRTNSNKVKTIRTPGKLFSTHYLPDFGWVQGWYIDCSSLLVLFRWPPHCSVHCQGSQGPQVRWLQDQFTWRKLFVGMWSKINQIFYEHCQLYYVYRSSTWTPPNLRTLRPVRKPCPALMVDLVATLALDSASLERSWLRSRRLVRRCWPRSWRSLPRRSKCNLVSLLSILLKC